MFQEGIGLHGSMLLKVNSKNQAISILFSNRSVNDLGGAIQCCCVSEAISLMMCNNHKTETWKQVEWDNWFKKFDCEA